MREKDVTRRPSGTSGRDYMGSSAMAANSKCSLALSHCQVNKSITWHQAHNVMLYGLDRFTSTQESEGLRAMFKVIHVRLH